MFTPHPILKLISFLMIGVFLLVVGLSVSMGMIMSMDGTMSPCPFMDDHGAICPMTVAAHISSWQQLSTALPTLVSVTALISLLFCFAFFSVFKPSPQLQFFRRLRKRNLEVKVFSSLFLALSRGVIHSRLFV